MNKTVSAIQVGKLDAARRQLQTAIELWFNDKEPVSTHTLAYCAYEIIHVVSKKRNPSRRALLFDTPLVDEKHRVEFAREVKKDANFFKHADRDNEMVLEFHPALTEMYLIFASIGLEVCGEQKHPTEEAFVWWLYLHRPEIFSHAGEKYLRETVSLKAIDHVRRLGKREFFQAFHDAKAHVLKHG